MSASKPAARKLVKSTTLGNLDQIYDVYEGQDLIQSNDDYELKEMSIAIQPKKLVKQGTINFERPENADGYLLNSLSPQKQSKNKTFGGKKAGRSKDKRGLLVGIYQKTVKAVMVFNLLLGIPQKKSKLKKQLSKSSFTVYPENISMVHPELRAVLNSTSSYLDKCKMSEKTSMSLT